MERTYYVTLLRSGTIVAQKELPPSLNTVDAETVCAIVDSLLEKVDPDLEYEVALTEKLS